MKISTNNSHYIQTCLSILSVGNLVLCFCTRELDAELMEWSGKWLIGQTRGFSSSKASWPWTSRISSLGRAVRSTMWSSKWLFLKQKASTWTQWLFQKQIMSNCTPHISSGESSAFNYVTLLKQIMSNCTFVVVLYILWHARPTLP